jgi:putative spermidine/putrescine transport system ATP-binding protein
MVLQVRSTSPRLELKSIKKAYGSVVAVENVNIELGHGEFLTLLGPSGSGKTTTLAMVAGLQIPTAGQILLDGNPIERLPPYRRNIGMVFQSYALFPHMTVLRNVAFPLEMRGVDKRNINKQVAEVLELVGLDDCGRRYPHELSGGQQQRVALARALVFHPPLLLMDEPLGALDKKLKGQMQLEIMRLHRDLGISIIYVTHDQEEALVMSDRIAVFRDGGIQQIGQPQELYERPMTRFVAGFLGESNFFSGTIKATDGEICVLDSNHGAIRGRNTGGLALGDKAIVAVRPEHVTIARKGCLERSDNILAGCVTDIVYLGQARKYVVETASADKILAFRQAQTIGLDQINVGDELSIGWQCSEANVLAD